jgi:hypothetical protein
MKMKWKTCEILTAAGLLLLSAWIMPARASTIVYSQQNVATTTTLSGTITAQALCSVANCFIYSDIVGEGGDLCAARMAFNPSVPGEEIHIGYIYDNAPLGFNESHSLSSTLPGTGWRDVDLALQPDGYQFDPCASVNSSTLSFESGNAIRIWADTKGGTLTYRIGPGDLFVGSLLSTTSSQPQIFFSFPTNNATTTIFNLWEIGFSGFPASNTYDGTLAIYYGVNGTSSVYADTTAFAPNGSSSGTIYVPRTAAPLWNFGDPVPILWAAYGVLTPAATTTIFTTGDTIFFNVYPTGINPSSTPPTTTSCRFTSSSFLGDPVGNIEQGICEAAVYLVIPGTAQQQDLATHFNDIRTAVSPKPPFGYFFGMISAFGAIGNGSSTISVWTAQIVDAFSVILDPVDAAFAALVGILFILWLLNRIGIINL